MDNSNTITVPGFQHFMIPFLKVLANKEVKHIRTIIEDVSKLENLTPEQCAVKLPSQSATLVVNRVAWVRTYLFKAGLINTEEQSLFKNRGLRQDLKAKEISPK